MTDTNDSKATKEAIKALKQEFFESRMALKQEWKEKIAGLPPEEQKAAKKAANDAYMQNIRDESEAISSLKAKSVSLTPEQAEALAKKAEKKAKAERESEAFREKMAAQKEARLARKELSPEELKAAKKADSEALSKRFREEEAAKLAEKLKDPEFAAKHALKTQKQEKAREEAEAYKAKRAQEKKDKEVFDLSIASMSPLEQMEAKEARKKAEMAKFLEEERIKKAPKLEEKLKDPKFAAKHAQKEAKRLADEERERVAYEKAGKIISSGEFHTKKFRFFENGYVAVDGWMLKGLPEKLIEVSSSVDVQKKTGLGRAAGAIVTAGMNLAGPNTRGDVYLFVVTEEATHTVHLDPPSPFEIRNARKVEALGKACLAMAESKNQQPPTAAERSADISEQLAKLVEFHKSGALTDDEFALAKSKLLS